MAPSHGAAAPGNVYVKVLPAPTPETFKLFKPFKPFKPFELFKPFDFFGAVIQHPKTRR
jgi:hypothetical protein